MQDFRVSVEIQDKASLAGNDGSFTRAITQDWVSTEAPIGQDDKRTPLQLLISREGVYAAVMPGALPVLRCSNKVYPYTDSAL